ncbi:N-acetylmuramoyl-L-alanine amidase [Bifidobacterium margollesii]|uniref:N-acetylmuramoyl-L-alanine amidase n=1 Tax=Bifidobacterium margollesii TaxID=2020964 RepID=A0A2N5J8X3_9BIFI|nr:N-acetylmuramoyl-L-alanine amidase [Bifidobacterium margollesii]PLS30635.1 N-acetylmuramoyl-L-alanine amidase [Bifidobacterium margollesii]
MGVVVATGLMGLLMPMGVANAAESVSPASSGRGDDVVSHVSADHAAKTHESAFASAGRSSANPSGGSAAASSSALTAAADLTGLATVGVTWAQTNMTDPATAPTLQIRYRHGGTWSGWDTVESVDGDQGVMGVSVPYYVGDATRAEARLTAKAGQTITAAKLIAVDSGYSASGVSGESGGADAAAGAADGGSNASVAGGASQASTAANTYAGRIHTREEWWRAGNAPMTWTPNRSGEWQGATVHHTDGRNYYSRAEVPAIINGIYNFHASASNGGRGWGDIGYNLLVDRFGGIWEGRDEGVPNQVVRASRVIGAHSRGFNSATFGVALLGTYDVTGPSNASINSLSAAIAWEFQGLHIRSAKDTFQYKGRQDRITGHGAASHHSDPANYTDCPGRQVWNRMGTIRNTVQLMLDGQKSGNPVYRVYNRNSGLHHYTTSFAEVINAVSAGWRYEGVSFHAAAWGARGSVPVFREYNPNNGNHNWTMNRAEHNMLIRAGWRSEKTAWYVPGFNL